MFILEESTGITVNYLVLIEKRIKERIKEDAIRFDSLAGLFEGQKTLVLAEQAQPGLGTFIICKGTSTSNRPIP
jgi:hypothetical protein